MDFYLAGLSLAKGGIVSRVDCSGLVSDYCGVLYPSNALLSISLFFMN